jgi:hypothetical protein
MKQFWRRPFQFWNDFKRAVEAKQVPEPAWYRTVLKNPPGQYNTKGERPWPKLSFPLDNYRKLYYQDYPNEALQYGHSALPGTKGANGGSEDCTFKRPFWAPTCLLRCPSQW